jgi:hypothetical protein
MEKRTTKRPKYVVCIRNTGYETSLEQRKLYALATAERNDPPKMSRVIDESGEDYLYPSDWFVPIDLPTKAKRALAAV